MEKVDMGYLRVVATKRGVLKDCVVTDLSFTSLDVPAGLHNIDNEQCYLVKKADLDAYEARKESLEQMNCTPVWDENQRLTAKVKALEAENAYLTRINEDFFKERSKLVEENEALVERNTKLKCDVRDMVDKFYGMTSAGRELRAANEKLAAEVDGLNKRISHLKVILEHDENRMASLITENNKLRGTYNELNSTVAKLRQDLAKYSGVQEVIDIRTTCDQDCFVLWWTGRNGDKHKLEFKLIQNPMDETMCREVHIYDPTRT